MKKFVFLIVFILIHFSHVYGRILNFPSYTYPDPQSVTAILSAGDTVRIYPGEYDFGVVYITSPSIVFESVEGSESVKIHIIFKIENGDNQNTVIRGLTIDDYDTGLIPFEITGSSPLIEDVVISNTTARYLVYCTDADPVFKNCKFLNNKPKYLYNDAAVELVNSSPLIREAVILNKEFEFETAIECTGNSNPEIRNSTIISGSISIRDESSPEIYNTIICYNFSPPLSCESEQNTPVIECSNFYGNSNEDWVDYFADQYGINGNISSRPYFCNLGLDDFHLLNISECLGENNECGETIGAFGQGCIQNFNTYYVDQSGEGDFLNIKDAIIAAQSGDTIIISDGTYSGEENTNLKFYEKLLSVRSSGGSENCIIDCEATNRAFTFLYGLDSTAELRGITFYNTSRAHGGGIVILNGELRLIDCRFIDEKETPPSFIPTGCAIYAASCGLNLSECSFIRKWAPYGSVIDGSGLNIDMDNCIFQDNGDKALYLGSSQGSIRNTLFFKNDSAGVYLFNSDIDIDNCTFVYNGTESGGITLELIYKCTVNVSNSIFAYNFGDATIDTNLEDCEINLSCTDIYGNPAGNWVGIVEDQYRVNGNLAAKPLFCDLDGNFQLNSESPCAPSNNECGVLIGAGSVGCISTDIVEYPENLPLIPSLDQNYPNPFNPETRISFALPERTDIKLYIYNIMGQKVATVTEGSCDAGIHTITWDGSKLASGVYFYKLTAGDYEKTRKMILLK